MTKLPAFAGGGDAVRLISATVAICVLAGASLQPASAQTYIGYDTSCGYWTKVRADEKKGNAFAAFGMRQWAFGLLSGANMFAASKGKG